jgi:hypothetical protein
MEPPAVAIVAICDVHQSHVLADVVDPVRVNPAHVVPHYGKVALVIVLVQFVR